MKTVKIGGGLLFALLTFNSLGQAEVRSPRSENVKEEIQIETPEQRAKVQTDRLMEQLVLSEDQKAKIYETNVGVNMKNDAVKQHATWTSAQKKEALDGNNAGRISLIKSYLTPEQIVKFDEMQSAKVERQEMKTDDSNTKTETKKVSKKK